MAIAIAGAGKISLTGFSESLAPLGKGKPGNAQGTDIIDSAYSRKLVKQAGSE